MMSHQDIAQQHSEVQNDIPDTKTVTIFGNAPVLPEQFRISLRRALRGAYAGVVSVKRNIHKGCTKFRVTIRDSFLEDATKALRRSRKRCGWVVMYNFKRKKPQTRPARVEPTLRRDVISLNVRGLARKRDRVRKIVENSRLFALQETNLKPNDFLFTTRHHNVFHSFASGPGKRGLCLGVHKSLAAHQSYASEYACFVTIPQFS
jgi:hypothetical protein